MAKGRDYAENLVGPLDRSFYETQRKVTQQTNQTNWEDLQNQYKNLTDQLKRKQEQANIDFANGLVGVAEGSLGRMASANQDMANRGLTSSGLNNLIEQSDTAIKGEQILNLLGAAGDIATATAGQLADSNTTYANKAADLNAGLADALGDINAGDVAAQMSYNKGLADIGEAMEAREAQNELEAAQREANRRASGYGTKEEDEEFNEFMRRVAIADTLADETLDDKAKENILNIRLGVKNSGQVIEAYKKNIKETERYNNDLAKAKKDIEKEQRNKQLKETGSNVLDFFKTLFLGTEIPVSDEPIVVEKPKRKEFDKTPADYIFGTGVTIPDSDKPLPSVSDVKKAKQKKITEKAEDRVTPITYEELAELLYGI